MNKEYTYIDGKVIISDENNNKTQCEYYDNLDEVLVQENLIETMENNIEKLEKESKSYKRKRIHYIPWVFILVTLISIIGVPFFMNYMTVENLFAMQLDTVFGTINAALAISLPIDFIAIGLSGIVELINYNDYKEERKNKPLVYI